jgi:hypothetical protein
VTGFLGPNGVGKSNLGLRHFFACSSLAGLRDRRYPAAPGQPGEFPAKLTDLGTRAGCGARRSAHRA